MRPGQTAPECKVEAGTAASSFCSASMRPGQTAPECIEFAPQRKRISFGFNEAGADCPGMLPDIGSFSGHRSVLQ